MADMTQTEAEVAEVKDPTVSVSVLLSGITNRIKDALGQGDYSAVRDIVEDVDRNNQKLAAAATSIPEPKAPEPEEAEAEEDEAEEAEGYEAHTVEELKEFLRERDLPVSGSKEELVARLEEADEAEG